MADDEGDEVWDDPSCGADKRGVDWGHSSEFVWYESSNFNPGPDTWAPSLTGTGWTLGDGKAGVSS